MITPRTEKVLRTLVAELLSDSEIQLTQCPGACPLRSRLSFLLEKPYNFPSYKLDTKSGPYVIGCCEF